jgi:DNA-binding MarR family transcriptional regulator
VPDQRGSSRIDVVIRLAKVTEIVLYELELTLNQFRLLTMVEEGISSSRELGLRLVVKAPNVTVLVRTLTERGLLKRRPSEHDGRRIVLSLTPKGRKLIQRAERQCELALHNVAAYVETPDGADALVASLDAWVAPLDVAALRLREVAAADQPYRQAGGERARTPAR